MAASEQDQSGSINLYRNMTQFCYAVSANSERAMLEFLKNGFDINARVPPNNPFKSSFPRLNSVSALQFACKSLPKRSLDVLLDNGADFTMKNVFGSTALHSSIENQCDTPSKVINYLCTQKLLMAPGYCAAERILSAHVKNNVTVNPVNNHGLSHFHIACMFSHVEAVKLFLDSGVQVNDPILFESPVLPGYTALHIASRFGSHEAVQLLVKHGADARACDKYGSVPLQLICPRTEELSLLALRSGMYSRFQEFILKLHVDTYNIASTLIQETFDTGTLMNELCTACAKKDIASINKILDKGVDINTRSNFGFTALHCAALIDFEVTKLLLERGADIFLKNDDGISPLDICTWKHGYRISQLLPSVQQIKTHINLQGQSWRIASALHSNASLTELLSDASVAQEINTACISSESSLWPGATALHLAIILTRSDPRDVEGRRSFYPKCIKDTLETLISRGASMMKRDAKHQTPIHLAYYLRKFKIVRIMMEMYFISAENQHYFQEDLVDEAGLSNLHIACIVGSIRGMEVLLRNNASPNIPVKSDMAVSLDPEKSKTSLRAGSTPLHIAARLKNIQALEVLVAYSADIFAKDADGLTPVDVIASKVDFDESELVKLTILFIRKYCIAKSNFVLDKEKMCCFEKLFMALDSLVFHACYGFDIVTSESRIEEYREIIESDRDDRLKSIDFCLDFLETLRENTSHGFDHRTVAAKWMSSLKKIVLNSLKRHDASIHEYVRSYAALTSWQWESLAVLDNQSQLTNLHLACILMQEELIEKLMKTNVDVNCTLSPDSPFFPGFTPFHHAIRYAEPQNVETNARIVQFMLKHGADPTIQDVNNETPLHLAERYCWAQTKITDALLLDPRVAQKNLTSKFFRSHFHIACKSNLPEVVERFLQYAADPNEPNYHSDNEVWRDLSFGQRLPAYEAFVPLQATKNLQVVEVLLKYGADPKIENYKGFTALHFAAQRRLSAHQDADIIKMLIRDGGADVNARSVLHLTPLDVAITERMENDEEECRIRTLLEHGALINRESFVGSSTFARAVDTDDPRLLQTLIKYGVDVNVLNERQRTVMHELFARNQPQDLRYLSSADEYIVLVEQLCEKGIDIDCTDSFKRTPLHMAVQNCIASGVVALLTCGADINMTDYKDHTPLSLLLTDDTRDRCGCKFISPFDQEEMFLIFHKHMLKMRVFNVPISSQNTIGEGEYISSMGDNKTLDDTVEKVQQSDELEKMKATVLKENVTLYNVMYMDYDQLALLVKDDTLRSALRSLDFHMEYPELGGILKLKLRIAQRESRN